MFARRFTVFSTQSRRGATSWADWDVQLPMPALWCSASPALPVAVAFGNESHGITGVCGGALEGDNVGCEWVYVPMVRGVRSLNLAATAAVGLTTAARRLKVGPFSESSQ